MTLERGAILHNRYRIVEILGEGGMGAVYRAVDENLGIEVAVKENFFTSEEYARQFRREANILASMRHPYLPRVTDHFVIKGQGQYLVLDYIEGEDLRERIDRMGILPEEDVIVLGVAICEALSYFHQRTPPILHRDIKPGNVKITPSGDVYLVDFGLAKIVYGTRETTPGARAMTPGYSPPEQYGTARTDRRTDIYSLGATLYEALTATIPEDGLGRLMEQTTLIPVRERNPNVSKRLAAVIEKALAVHPEDRYQTAEQFRQALISASRSTARRQLTDGSLRVSPPPAVDLADFVDVEPPAEMVPKTDDGPAPFPISAPLDEAPPASLQRRRRSRRGTWLLVVLLGLIMGGGAGSFLFFPEVSVQALSLIPFPGLTSSFGLGVASATPTQQAPGVVLPARPTATPSLTPTIPPTPTVDPTTRAAEAVVDPPTATPTATQTPLPTPMGGSGQIAFASDRTGVAQIWIVNFDGSGLHQVTDMADGACQPDWSPDGTQLVFISPCRNNQEIYPNSSLFIINADGSELTPLPTILGGDYDPDWSPDGKRIAFTSLRNGNLPQVHTIELEDYSVQGLSLAYVQDSQPAWSPDGSKLAYTTLRRGPFQIWTMDPNGLSQERFSRSGGAKNGNPVWSPDGAVLVYDQSKRQGEVPTLVAARYEEGGLNEIRFFQDWSPSREAAYSPDGFWIAYEGWPDGNNHDIYVMTANGTDKRPLTTHPNLDFDPAWRPLPPG